MVTMLQPMETRTESDRVVFRTGALAAFLTAIIIPIQVVVLITNPLPTTVDGWLALLAANRFVGLVELDLLLTVDYILLIGIFVALYVALDGRRSGLVLLATVFGIAGAVLYVASNPALAMLAVSDQYTAAATDAGRSSAYAAAQATLATFGGTAYHASYIVGSVVLVGISVPMLRHPGFGRAAGWLGIVSNVVALGLYVPTVGLALAVLSVFGLELAVLSVFGLELWYILLGLRLSRLAGGYPPRS